MPRLTACLVRVLVTVFATALALWPGSLVGSDSSGLVVEGVQVTPHVRAPGMRYRREPDDQRGALIRVFVRNGGATAVSGMKGEGFRVDGRTPVELLEQKAWWWHDTPAIWSAAETAVPAGALSVWTCNLAEWIPGQTLRFTDSAGSVVAGNSWPVRLDPPEVWLASVTFLGAVGSIRPDRVLIHLANGGDKPLRLDSCRFWLPTPGESYRWLHPGPWLTNGLAFPHDGLLKAGDHAGWEFRTDPLPLGYVVVEARVTRADGSPASAWAHLRVRNEFFDISGGWVADDVHGRQALTFEPFLKTLRRFHLNTGHIQALPGYTDTELYRRYPLKYFNALAPIAEYDRDEILPRIHAVEFLGEPQYGGGRPVPPMVVFERLRPYASSRLATTVTHSEERVWQTYAGLSDYPHYDAYRVTAPSADLWRKYDRWEGGRRIGWGAPLETIGEMCRSLREMYRPVPTAYWSQGPHRGWEVYDGRRRTSPTPDELRLQAYHALGSRITSLYWFNLSLGSIVKFRDTLDELTRVGREIRMVEDLVLEGAAYDYERQNPGGRLEWDLASIAGPRALVCFALDLNYQPDPKEKVFKFGDPRPARFSFRLPPWLPQPAEIFQYDAEGVHDVASTVRGGRVEMEAQASRVALFVASRDLGLRSRIEERRRALVAEEEALGFDPGRNDADFEVLRRFSEGKP